MTNRKTHTALKQPAVLLTAVLFTASFITLIVSCDIFLLPLRDRTNPLDTDAPIRNLRAVPQSSNSVELTWDLPEEAVPDTIYFVRKTDYKPLSKEDGTPLPEINIENRSYTDSVEANNNYYYACWVGTGTADTGPIYLKTGTFLKSKRIQVSEDGYLEDSSVVAFTSNIVAVSGGGMPVQSVTLLRFPADTLPDNIHSAEFHYELTFFTNGPNATTVYPIAEPWNADTITWSTVTSGTFYDSTYVSTVSIQTPVGSYSADITTAMDGLIQTGSTGLYWNTSANDYYTFGSLESSGAHPVFINIEYFGLSD